MNKTQKLEEFARREFQDVSDIMIMRNDDGDYELFGKYRIVPAAKDKYFVYLHDNEVGMFCSSRTAISWCIVDKYQEYNIARQLLNADRMLGLVSNDIQVRSGIARRRQRESREIIDVKLETKIIRKKALENELTKYVNRAKYLQQRGFQNEIARTGRNATNKTSRQSI